MPPSPGNSPRPGAGSGPGSGPGTGRPAAQWQLDPPYGARTVLAILVVFVFLVVSGRHTEIDRMFYMLGEAAGNVVGLNESSQVVKGTAQIARSMFPIRISEVTEISRIENFDPENLPPLARIETEEVEITQVNPVTLALERTTQTRTVLYQPVGYLMHVLRKMLETIEIALWATLFSIILSVPLAYYSSANYSPNRLAYGLARGVVISLFPAAVAWLVFLPMDGAGLLGLSLGILTPVFVLGFNIVWGLATEGLAELCGVYRERPGAAAATT